MGRPLVRAGLVALCALSAGLAAPSLAVSKGPGALSFAGQCQFAGTSTFSSSVTLVPSPRRNDVAAEGTCSGTGTGPNGQTTQLSSTAVQYRASEFGPKESCAADPNATGDGELIFPQGALHFHVVENRVGGQAALSYTGRAGGSATGVAYVNSSNPAALLEQCAESGITSSPVSIVFQTTPTISG